MRGSYSSYAPRDDVYDKLNNERVARQNEWWFCGEFREEKT